MFDGFDGSAHHIEKDLESTREIGFNEIKSDGFDRNSDNDQNMNPKNDILRD